MEYDKDQSKSLFTGTESEKSGSETSLKYICLFVPKKEWLILLQTLDKADFHSLKIKELGTASACLWLFEIVKNMSEKAIHAYKTVLQLAGKHTALTIWSRDRRTESSSPHTECQNRVKNPPLMFFVISAHTGKNLKLYNFKYYTVVQVFKTILNDMGM